MEKLVPHPHDAVAFGLWIWKDWPMRSSTKSISASLHERQRHRIDQDDRALALDDDVIGGALGVEIEAVLEAVAAAAGDADAQSGAAGLAGQDPGDPPGGAFGERDPFCDHVCHAGLRRKSEVCLGLTGCIVRRQRWVSQCCGSRQRGRTGRQTAVGIWAFPATFPWLGRAGGPRRPGGPGCELRGHGRMKRAVAGSAHQRIRGRGQ